MKSKLFVIVTILFLSIPSFAQQNSDSWNDLRFLIGNWKGEGSGSPGQGEGTFTFKLDLDNNILVRTSHSEYPATANKPATIHDDLMIIYRDHTGIPNRAIYFDNENHIINYSITFLENKVVVFTSDKIPNVPAFRLTYASIDNITVNIKFELSQDGEKFFTYIDGKAKRVE
jgi:hypothetical protein